MTFDTSNRPFLILSQQNRHHCGSYVNKYRIYDTWYVRKHYHCIKSHVIKVPVMVGAFGGNLRFSPRMAYREDFGILLVRRAYGEPGTEKPARVRHGVISDAPSEAPQTYVPLGFLGRFLLEQPHKTAIRYFKENSRYIHQNRQQWFATLRICKSSMSSWS